MAVGGEKNNFTELYDIAKDEWKTRSSYPFASTVSETPIVYYDGGYFMFGGYGVDDTLVARYDVTGDSWSHVGKLADGRYGHAVIRKDNDFMIVGGKGTQPTNVCRYQNSEMNCEKRDPFLWVYYLYPEVLAVDTDFCKET